MGAPGFQTDVPHPLARGRAAELPTVAQLSPALSPPRPAPVVLWAWVPPPQRCCCPSPAPLEEAAWTEP